ncbi:MAG: FAD-dependent oxidoreductase [Bdellovibrionales bacterium]|nr:FAD-dependent oxidoreductase [Bdellovibrionales bacterium]
MARVVVLGAGISGHTAATILRRKLSKEHQVIVVTPKSYWNWIPSNIWVGVGLMKSEDVCFSLQKIYDKIGVDYIQASATAIYPEGTSPENKPYIEATSTVQGREGEVHKIEYDYLINATGPKLNFAATEGLGPEKYTYSVCTASHATESAKKLAEIIEQMKQGHKKKIIVGSGHGLCTCQGAAFEYVFNVEYELRRHKVRDKAEITFLTNEYELGDFGIGGAHFKRGGYYIHSKVFAESLYAERGIRWVKRAHIQKVDAQKVYF